MPTSSWLVRSVVGWRPPASQGSPPFGASLGTGDQCAVDRRRVELSGESYSRRAPDMPSPAM